MRLDGRRPDEMRKVKLVPRVNPYAEGSVAVAFGNTEILVTATVEKEIPKWMDQAAGGWITAEYGMLPRSTHTRNRREAASGKQGGRTLEIQRLVGRALRQAIDTARIPGLTIRLDCDVMVADGGTRTASISGGWLALAHAITWAKAQGLVAEDVIVSPVAAVSVGVCNGECVLDLCYEEDSSADFDLNLVFDEQGGLIEIQGTGEKRAITQSELAQLLNLGRRGAEQIIGLQREALKNFS